MDRINEFPHLYVLRTDILELICDWHR